MGRYKCYQCKTIKDIDPSELGIQCEICGSRIFYKERPPTQKRIKAR